MNKQIFHLNVKSNYFKICIGIMIGIVPCRAQDSTNANSYNGSEIAALYSMAATMTPLAIAGVAINLVPPSFGVVIHDLIAYSSLSFETGVGVGERRATGVFSNYRLTANYTHIYSRNMRDPFRIEMKKDFHFAFVDRRKIFLSGMHVSAGVISDFPNYGYTAGAGVWLKTPWLSFIGFIPEHTIGLVYRRDIYFTGRSFDEISLGVASAFTF